MAFLLLFFFSSSSYIINSKVYLIWLCYLRFTHCPALPPRCSLGGSACNYECDVTAKRVKPVFFISTVTLLPVIINRQPPTSQMSRARRIETPTFFRIFCSLHCRGNCLYSVLTISGFLNMNWLLISQQCHVNLVYTFFF